MKSSKHRREQRKRAKVRAMNNEQFFTDQMFQLDCCPQEACGPVPVFSFQSAADRLEKIKTAKRTPTTAHKSERRNEDMHVSQDVNINERTTEAARREYFLERLEETYSNKVYENQKFFGLIDDDRPSSPKGIVDRILAGKYVFQNPTKADAPCYDPLNQIRWRDPAVVADQAGFDAASKKLSDLQTTTTDAIWAETDPSKLPALVASFETATVH